MSSAKGIKPKPLSAPELKKLMVEYLQKAPDTDNPESWHALFHHLERGIQTDDVIYGIKADWKRFKVLPFKEYFWQWNYRIETQNADEKSLTLVVAVDTANREFEVITRWTDEEENA
jgi:FPC/CPF motif-containing protein YcgG